MTKEEVFADPSFGRLSEQQQAFVRALIGNAIPGVEEKIEAAFAAYRCKDRATATTLANRCMKKLSIQRLVDGYFGESPEDKIPTLQEMAAAAWQKFNSADKDADAHKWFTAVWTILKPKDEAGITPTPPAAPKVDSNLVQEFEAIVNGKQPPSE